MKLNAALIAVIFALTALILMRGEDPKVQELRDKLAALEEVDAYRTELVEEADARADSAEAEADSAIALAARMTRAAEAETDRKLAALPDSVQRVARPIIDAERSAHQAAVDSLNAAHERRDRLRLAQVAARDSLIVTLREQIATGAELADELDGRMSILGLNLPKPKCVAGASIAVGYGRAVGAGVTCGVPL